MKVGIIDADLLRRKQHTFPNLASMKISAYYKSIGGGGTDVRLLNSYDSICEYDKVFISKVFTDTEVPDGILDLENVEYGGTGFWYDKAKPLLPEIEHIMPDYHLYDEFVGQKIVLGDNPSLYKWYTDYSIGFLTRGCFRHCEFCVNKNYNQSLSHSPVEEFYDPSRKKLCFLDDNFLACSNWRTILDEVISLNKPFIFKQGLDERLLTKEKCEVLFNCKYDGQFIFAFDNIADRNIIEEKLKLIRECTDKQIRFYVLVGFDRKDKWDAEFWKQDLYDMFERIDLLRKYKCLPYIMRFNRYKESPYRGTYITVARWCNQPSIFKKKTLTEFIEQNQAYVKKVCADVRYYNDIKRDIPDLIDKYYNVRW